MKCSHYRIRDKIPKIKERARYSQKVFDLVFLFSFLLKIENDNENVFDWISESKNKNRKQPENENNKFLFSVFLVDNRNLKYNFKQI